MKLTHHTDEPFVLDRARIYEQTERWTYKPTGLWLSVDDDWHRWCENEGFRTESFVHTYVATLTEEANTLHLATPEDIDKFTECYKLDDHRMDWARLATEVDGIIIAPYQWSRRLSMDAFWYYPWDCASACIWNLDAIDTWEEE